MRRPLLIRLRPTLLTAIVGLVVLTAAALGGAAAILTFTITRTLIHENRTAAVTAAREETALLFSVPPRIAGELATEAQRGALPLDNRQHLAALFSERLRAFPRLAIIGYGNEEGDWYAGAGRSDEGGIVEYLADPKINGSIPVEATVAADGAHTPYTPHNTDPYFVVTRPWYSAAVGTDGPVWSPFYRFATDAIGITCSRRFTEPGSTTPTGVFHVDVELKGIAKFLASLHVGKHGAVFLVDGEGHRIVTPPGDDVEKAAQAIDAAVARHATATLADPADIRIGGRIYEVIFEPVPTEGGLELRIGVVVNLRDISRGSYQHAAIAAAVALIALVLAVFAGRSLSSRIANPIVTIARDLAKVGAFEISRDPAPRSFIREVSDLGASVDRMKASLRSFGHYVPTDLVRRLLAHGEEAELGGEIRRLTIYFSDIANFTTISEGLDPDRLVDAVGRYLELMTGTITRCGGTVDKFIGDGIMAFFNAPEELPDHPRLACLAALEGQRMLAEMAAATPRGEPVFRTRIGLGLGEVLVGNVGTPQRFAYTLLGDEVNLASRLEGLNKLYGTMIIASGTVMDETGDGLEWRRLDRVAVKGRRQGTLICELLGPKGEVAADILAARDIYEQALDAYFARQFDRAGDLFDEAMRLRPGDLAAAMMRERAHELADDPPLTWDGVHVMEEK
jgi:adenylate cyclase